MDRFNPWKPQGPIWNIATHAGIPVTLGMLLLLSAFRKFIVQACNRIPTMPLLSEEQRFMVGIWSMFVTLMCPMSLWLYGVFLVDLAIGLPADIKTSSITVVGGILFHLDLLETVLNFSSMVMKLWVHHSFVFISVCMALISESLMFNMQILIVANICAIWWAGPFRILCYTSQSPETTLPIAYHLLKFVYFCVGLNIGSFAICLWLNIQAKNWTGLGVSLPLLIGYVYANLNYCRWCWNFKVEVAIEKQRKLLNELSQLELEEQETTTPIELQSTGLGNAATTTVEADKTSSSWHFADPLPKEERDKGSRPSNVNGEADKMSTSWHFAEPLPTQEREKRSRSSSVNEEVFNQVRVSLQASSSAVTRSPADL